MRARCSLSPSVVLPPDPLPFSLTLLLDTVCECPDLQSHFPGTHACTILAARWDSIEDKPLALVSAAALAVVLYVSPSLIELVDRFPQPIPKVRAA